MGATEDLIEMADIILRHKRNGLMAAYNAVRALEEELPINASRNYKDGIQDAAAAILDEIHKLDEGEDEDGIITAVQRAEDIGATTRRREHEDSARPSDSRTPEARTDGETGSVGAEDDA